MHKSIGVPAKVVQEILWHSLIKITLGIYAHVLPGMHKEAMNKMDDWFGNDDEKNNLQKSVNNALEYERIQMSNP
jgi:hypothetical protein